LIGVDACVFTPYYGTVPRTSTSSPTKQFGTVYEERLMYRTICVAVTVAALLAPSHADGQPWKRLRGGGDSTAKPGTPATVTAQDLAGQLAAGRAALNGVRFSEDGRLDDASAAQMALLAEALKNAHGRYRVDAFVVGGTDTVDAKIRSAMYASTVRAVLVTSGVPSAALSGAPTNAAAASAAGQSRAGTAASMGASQTSAAGGLVGGKASGLAGGIAGSVAGAKAGGDTSHAGMAAGDVAKAAAENIIPGAKLAKMGFNALRNRGAAQAHADSTVGSVAGAKASGDTSHTGTSTGEVAKAAAEDLIPGAKLAKMGFSAFRNRGAEQARADSTARLGVARIEIVKIS
jgi:hypothetical protein